MSQSSIDTKDLPLLVFDFETTMRGKNRNPSAWVPENKPLCLGLMDDDTTPVVPIVLDCTDADSESVVRDTLILRIQNKPLLVGHHMQFDLSYMMRFYNDAYMKMRELNMWDTQVAAYMLDAHLHKFPSLKSALKRADLGSALKSDLLETTLKDKKNNKTTEDITMKDLMSYCGSDCFATYNLAIAQMNMAQEIDPKLVILIMQRSSLAAPLAEMEMQGLAYDVGTSITSLVRMETEKVLTKRDIGSALAKRIFHITSDTRLASYITSNPDDYIGSNSMWGYYFFGGSYCFSYKVADGVYRSGTRKGKEKLKTHKTIVEFPAIVDAKPYGSSRTKTGCWTFDSDVLNSLMLPPTTLSADDIRLVSMLSACRVLSKIIQTYLLPLQEAVVNGKIHPSIHQTSTVTGRLSQSEPNLQNIANIKEIKSCFIPSSPDLCFIEADYKQLEMIAFAYVYRDPLLLDDLRKGVDIHEMIGRKLYGTAYSPEVRRGVKGVNFGMIYGGGANTISKQVGLSYNEVLRIIGYFQGRYSTIKGTRQVLMSDISKNFRACPFKYDDKAYGIYTSETGRRYAIEMEARATTSGIEWTPWYTHVCNYPIQGLATGDIVPMMLLHIWRSINEQSLPITIINTIHDSFLFEVPKVEAEKLGLWIKEELEKAPEVYKRWFGKEFDLALPVSVKYTNHSWHGPWKEINPF